MFSVFSVVSAKSGRWQREMPGVVSGLDLQSLIGKNKESGPDKRGPSFNPIVSLCVV
jgi:hypothetical protein